MRDAGHRTPDAGRRTSDGEKSKNNISTPQGGGHNTPVLVLTLVKQNVCLMEDTNVTRGSLAKKKDNVFA